MNQSDFEVRFAPVFALKAAAGSISPEAKPLKSQDRQRNWDALMEVLPSVLSKCSGIDFHPDNADYPPQNASLLSGGAQSMDERLFRHGVDLVDVAAIIQATGRQRLRMPRPRPAKATSARPIFCQRSHVAFERSKLSAITRFASSSLSEPQS